jgi:hypothetical protein
MTAPPESYPRFTREIVTPDPALLDSIAARWTAGVNKELGTSPVLTALVVFAVFALPIYGLSHFVAEQNLMIAFGCTAGAALGGAFAYRSRKSRQTLAATIANLKTSTRAIRHTLDLSGPHRFVFHEHGLVVLAPLAPGRTFCEDISSCSDHPLDPVVEDAYQAKTLRSRWTWYDLLPVTGEPIPMQGFSMDGAPLAPQVRDDFTEGEELGAFIDLFGDEWLPDDNVAKIDYDQLLAADAALRAKRN